MTKLIMVDGGTLAHGSGSTITGGAFVITSTPNANVGVDTKGVYTTALTYTFSGGSAPGFVVGDVASVGPQALVATAQETNIDALAPMREDDTGVMACEGELLAGGTGTVNGPVIVDDAGQDNTECN